MTLESALGAAAAAVMLIYLLYSLVRPEKF